MPKPADTVLQENFDLLHSLDNRHNTAKGTYTYQIMKIFAMKYAEIDMNLLDIFNIISMENAVGVYLDYHGIEHGLFRKGATKATTTVKLTGPAVGFNIPLGSTFETNSGFQFVTTEAAILPKSIAIRRGVGTDGMPEPYSDVESIAWINTTPMQSGTAYIEDTDWTFDAETQEITWLTAGPAAGSLYFIGLEASVSVTVDVIAASYGEDYRVSPGMITVNTNGLSGVETVTNEENSLNGENQETDIFYRNRLRKNSNVKFGYENIAAIIAGMDFVRACRVYQNTGVDQAFPSDDWDETDTWTDLETASLYDSGTGMTLAQTFSPSQDVITIAEVSLHVRKTGSPPPLCVSLYKWMTSYSNTVSRSPLWWQNFTEEDLNADYPTEWQEINVKCRHGGLDWTKDYLIVLSMPPSTVASAANHWDISYQSAGNEYAGGDMYVNGTISTGADMAFKTRWGGASYNVIIAMEEGESFDEHRDEIWTDMLDYNKESRGPVSIQPNLLEATEVSINITCTIYTDDLTDWSTTSLAARININDYINSLAPGDNVIFSMIERAILTAPGVSKIIGCTIQRNNETPITKAEEYDIKIGLDEIASLGSPGTTFTKGVW